MTDQALLWPSPEHAFGGGALSIGVQTVLYNNNPARIDCSLASLARARDLAVSAGVCAEFVVHYGDCSSRPCLSQQNLDDLRKRHGKSLRIEYQFFDANIGSAAGQNRLAANNGADLFFLMNPDVIVSPRSFEIMLGEFAVPGTGLVEAKQLPIEHPKDYDVHTGETSWSSGACTMIAAPLFRSLNGYDSDCFFLYCDDVDLSWRARLAGFKVIFQPAAKVFHDKRLGLEGDWLVSEVENYYSAEADLLLTHKWSRPDLTERYMEDFREAGLEHLLRAVAEFERRRDEGRLPAPIDADHRVGQFVRRNYAEHRFPL